MTTWLHEINSCGLYYKSFTIVIYDGNDSTIVESITIKLNYDHKASVIASKLG